MLLHIILERYFFYNTVFHFILTFLGMKNLQNYTWHLKYLNSPEVLREHPFNLKGGGGGGGGVFWEAKNFFLFFFYKNNNF